VNNLCKKIVLFLHKSNIFQLFAVCQEHNLKLHCDGARLFNAAAAVKMPPAALVSGCDSVNVCFSKGLGAPFGAVVVGTEEFIKR